MSAALVHWAYHRHVGNSEPQVEVEDKLLRNWYNQPHIEYI